MTLSHEQLRRCTAAVDLGAARTRVYLRQSGLVVDEPSVVAVDTRSGRLIEAGARAERMAGRTPDTIRIVRPISGGTVVDVDVAERMLRTMVGARLRRSRWRRPMLRAAVCVPHDADPLGRRAACEAMAGIGAGRVELADGLLAAAVGAGVPVDEPTPTMLVHCGVTTAQVAVVSLGSFVAAGKVPMGGETIDRALTQYLRAEHELLLPGHSVAPLHLSLSPGDGAGESIEVQGRDLGTGLGRSLEIDAAGLRAAVRAPMALLIDGVRDVLHRCEPDLVADLADQGVVITGGAARLPGLADSVRQGTGMPVRLADQPELCAIRGLGSLLDGRAPQDIAPAPSPGAGTTEPAMSDPVADTAPEGLAGPDSPGVPDGTEGQQASDDDPATATASDADGQAT